jgi:energy-coupling factor transporter transmembrane protein EcfT
MHSPTTTVVAVRERPQPQQQQAPQGNPSPGPGGGGNPTLFESPRNLDRVLALLFCTFFLLVILLIAIYFPVPTLFQYRVFKTVLALAAAGFGAALPGIFEFNPGKFVRCGGALLLFAAVYYTNVAGRIINRAATEVVILDDKRVDYEYGVSEFQRHKKEEVEVLKNVLSLLNVNVGVFDTDTEPSFVNMNGQRIQVTKQFFSDGEASLVSDIKPKLIIVAEYSLLGQGSEQALTSLASTDSKILIVRQSNGNLSYSSSTPQYGDERAQVESYEAKDQRLKNRIYLFAPLQTNRPGNAYDNDDEFKQKVINILKEQR